MEKIGVIRHRILFDDFLFGVILAEQFLIDPAWREAATGSSSGETAGISE